MARRLYTQQRNIIYAENIMYILQYIYIYIKLQIIQYLLTCSLDHSCTGALCQI